MSEEKEKGWTVQRLEELENKISELEKWKDIINKDHQKVVIDVDRLEKADKMICNYIGVNKQEIAELKKKYDNHEENHLCDCYSYDNTLKEYNTFIGNNREDINELKNKVEQNAELSVKIFIKKVTYEKEIAELKEQFYGKVDMFENWLIKIEGVLREFIETQWKFANGFLGITEHDDKSYYDELKKLLAELDGGKTEAFKQGRRGEGDVHILDSKPPASGEKCRTCEAWNPKEFASECEDMYNAITPRCEPREAFDFLSMDEIKKYISLFFPSETIVKREDLQFLYYNFDWESANKSERYKSLKIKEEYDIK